MNILMIDKPVNELLHLSAIALRSESAGEISRLLSEPQGDKILFYSAINCMDGRVRLPVISYLRERFGVQHVDVITEAGPYLHIPSRMPHVRFSGESRCPSTHTTLAGLRWWRIMTAPGRFVPCMDPGTLFHHSNADGLRKQP